MSYYKGKYPTIEAKGTVELVERLKAAREEKERLMQMNKRCQNSNCRNPGPLVFGMDRLKRSKKANRILAK